MKLEQLFAQLVQPGPDGTLLSSKLGKMLAVLAASQLGRFWMVPALFAAGAITMAGIYGLFKWILSTNVTANETSSVTSTLGAPQATSTSTLPVSLAPLEDEF